MTTQQIRDRTKTVTRRAGWTFLRPGDVVCAVEKNMGLKKGQKVKRLGLLRITSVRRERLDAITDDDVAREGFPSMTAKDFVEFLCARQRVRPDSIITRIAFEYQ